MRPEGYPTPTWQVPEPYGYPDAVSSAGSVAAPLLAGFTVTLIGLVIGQGSHMLAPGLALDVLALAAVVLVSAVQCAFNARRYIVTPSQLEAWWPDIDDERRRKEVRADQEEHSRQFRRWATWFRWTYNAGVVLLLTAVAVVLMPPPHHHVAERWIACGIVVVGLLTEIGWVVGNWAARLGREWWQSRKPGPSGTVRQSDGANGEGS